MVGAGTFGNRSVGDRCVVVEGRLQLAFAARESGQPLLQLVHPARRDRTLQEAVGTTRPGRLRYSPQRGQHREQGAEGVGGASIRKRCIGSYTRTPARRSASARTRGVTPRKSAPVLDMLLSKPWWAWLCRGE